MWWLMLKRHHLSAATASNQMDSWNVLGSVTFFSLVRYTSIGYGNPFHKMINCHLYAWPMILQFQLQQMECRKCCFCFYDAITISQADKMHAMAIANESWKFIALIDFKLCPYRLCSWLIIQSSISCVLVEQETLMSISMKSNFFGNIYTVSCRETKAFPLIFHLKNRAAFQ